MRPIFFLLLFTFFKMSCYAQERTIGEPVSKSRKQTEMEFAKSIQGVPLVIPLVAESDKTLFLMPVANDSITRRVDRLYLVDSTQDDFIYERDIYQVDCVKKNVDSDHSTYYVVVSSIKDGIYKEYEIDGYMYHQIRKINDNEYEYYKSNIKIPIIKITQK